MHILSELYIMLVLYLLNLLHNLNSQITSQDDNVEIIVYTIYLEIWSEISKKENPKNF